MASVVTAALLAGAGYQFLAVDGEAPHAGCLRRCIARVTAQTLYPDTIGARCDRICQDVQP